MALHWTEPDLQQVNNHYHTNAMRRDGISHALQCNTMGYNKTEYNDMPCHATRWDTMPHRAMKCNTMGYNTLCNAAIRCAMLCNAMPCTAIRWNTTEQDIMPCNAMQYNTRRCYITYRGYYRVARRYQSVLVAREQNSYYRAKV